MRYTDVSDHFMIVVPKGRLSALPTGRQAARQAFGADCFYRSPPSLTPWSPEGGLPARAKLITDNQLTDYLLFMTHNFAAALFCPEKERPSAQVYIPALFDTKQP